MKICINTIVFLLSALSLHGQSSSGLSNYFMVLPKEHPALAGADDFVQFNFSYSKPWDGLVEDVNSFSAGFFAPLGNKTAIDQIRRNARVSDESLIEKYSEDPSNRRRHGLGVLAELNNLGPQSEFEFKAYYAYHIPLNRKVNLSLGMSAAIYQQSIDFSNLTVRESGDEFYNQLVNSSGNQMRALGNFGMSVYTDQYYISLTGKSLIDQQMNGVGDIFSNFTREKSNEILMGYKFDLSRNMRMHLNSSVVYSKIYDLSYMGAARIVFLDFIYIGGAYFHDQKMSMLLGLNADKKFYLHYSYDYYLNSIKYFAQGTHQITANILIFNKYFKQPLSW